MSSKAKKGKRAISKMQREQQVAQRAQRRSIRHNTAVNQEKHRTDWLPLAPNEFGVVADRRIMPRDELSRRERQEQLSSANLAGTVSQADWIEMADESPYSLGMVIEVGPGLCRVSVDEAILICEFRGSLTAEGTGYTNICAVGDRVLVQPLDPGRGLVETVLPRRSSLARPDSFYGHLMQIIAANVDQLLIVASWRQPHIWLELIDEYLIGAARNNLQALICINKVDLADQPQTCMDAVKAYADLGYRLIFTSATTGYGIEALQQLLAGQSTVLAGLSGVGKSSLLTAVDPTLQLKVGEVNLERQQGRHTTTQAVMLPLSNGGHVIDTPGIRDFGLKGLSKGELVTFYPEIERQLGRCRFRNCTHSHEPGCAIKRSVDSGDIADWRYQNYCSIYQKLAA